MRRLGSLALVLVTACPFLLGCPPALPRGALRPPAADDLAVFDAVLAVAPGGGIAVTDRCREERSSRLVVVDATDDVMRRHVGYCASSGPTCVATAGIADANERWNARAEAGCLLGLCAGGSTLWVQDDVWPANLGRWRAEIFVSAHEPPDTRRALLVHEATHWIGGCSETGVDGAHARPELWGPDGVEPRARALLGL